MIVTKHFVMINFPKTGSSFARKVVKQAYENRERRLDRRILRKARLRPWPIRERRCFNPIRGYEDQHGRVEQIAESDRRKTVVSIGAIPWSESCRYTITRLQLRLMIISLAAT